ncbi:MAG: hypothetical protein HY775_12755 [Acidobacteria bacterium]|nr:hypothetical protein [Acidobacteriota bacterium]
MKRMGVVTALVGLLGVLTGGRPALADTRVVQSVSLVAGSSHVANAEGERAFASVLAYETASDTVFVEVRVCPLIGDCDTFSEELGDARIWGYQSQHNLAATLTGLGSVNLGFPANACCSPVPNYNVDPLARVAYAVAGTVTARSWVQGTIGPWQTPPGAQCCGIWAVDGTIAWLTA